MKLYAKHISSALISFYFSSLIFFLPNCNSSLKTISISADDDFSPLRRYSFKYRNLFTSYVNKYIKTGCKYKNTTEKTETSCITT